MTAIQRQNLSSQALEEIRRLILEGNLAPGGPIVESGLAADLGVSRTPLREALHSLEREGLVTSEPGRGFLVAQLVAREAQELYPLRALLEPLALRLSGLPDRKALVELTTLTQKSPTQRPAGNGLQPTTSGTVFWSTPAPTTTSCA